MLIAITSQGKDMESQVDSRFGRCNYFVFYETESDKMDSLENSGQAAGSGAGIQAAQTLIDRKVGAVITGNVGPKAFQTLRAGNIDIYNISGISVKEVVARFKEGILQKFSEPSVDSHSGLQNRDEDNSSAGARKIAVAAEDSDGMNSRVAAHFGRCPYYIMVEIQGNKTGSVEAVANPYYQAHQPGQVPAFIKSQKADVIIAGGMGQRAVGLFDQYGIEAVTGASGQVEQALAAYLSGSLRGTSPCSHDHTH